MTKEQSIGASSNKASSWQTIDWSKAQRNVRRLQLRIAKAIRAGKHGTAQALSWLLTHSHSAKLLAVKRVTENKGAKTPGVDNVKWRTDTQKYAAVQNLKRRDYRTLPLRRQYIPKKNGKIRPLSIPTMRDRAMQALHALALKPVAETVADRNSYGFREGRSCADAIGQCFCALAKSYAPVWVLEGDIKACFDRISHPWLLKPAKDGMKALVQKSRECIKGSLGQTAETLIRKLNPILRGWANYHRNVCSAKAFWTVDRVIHFQLLRWAKRTHPKKTYGWLKRKYFTAGGKFGFATRISDGTGEAKVLKLHSIPRTVLEWHIKVRGEANPYDPIYTEYFERRRSFVWRTLPRQRAGQTAMAGV